MMIVILLPLEYVYMTDKKNTKASHQINTDQSFSIQNKQLYCANEATLKMDLYRTYNDIPKADSSQLEELNHVILKQHDWFLNILQQYKLNSKEGMLLMSLAEALLRIPDQEGAQALFHDRLHRGSWLKKDAKNTLLAKALQWLGNQAPIDSSTQNSLFNKMTQQGAIEVCTLFIEQMSQRFVFAEDLEDALLRSRDLEAHEACSFDMLGEAALTFEESENYFSQYKNAIIGIGQYNQCSQDTPHEVSIKLSALHPRYQPEKFELLKQQLLPKLTALCSLAQQHNVLLTFDAEEQYRLELSVKILHELLAQLHSTTFKQGIGVAVQAYGKRGLAVIEELKSLSNKYDCQITVRLVKGAYWDYEIKSAQQLGLTDYPVWSQKDMTDDYFLMCAEALLNTKDHNLLAEFASHNPATLLQVYQLHDKFSSGNERMLKLQRLHGMGEAQHAYMAEKNNCMTRVYCPVGSRNKLLPYLVRRLIENGANTSFLYPQENKEKTNSVQLKKPSSILDYRNSMSFDIRQDYHFFPLYDFIQSKKNQTKKTQPQQKLEAKSSLADKKTIQQAAQIAYVGFHTLLTADKRIECLNAWANKLEENQSELIALLILQAGKTYQDAIDEVREACDFCRYYAKQAQQLLLKDNSSRPCITGELNQLQYKGKGIAVCISPWNFPLAIFVGQVAATWVTGNSVIAKPAHQTLDIAQYAINLAYESGIAPDQMQLLHCKGSELLPSLLEHSALQLVCFTGSTLTAKNIQQTLAYYDGPIIPFIAETGGQNVLIADSSALLDQLIPDIVQSAFHSAGQRCSALRIAYIQQDIFNEFCLSLKGHMSTLMVGDPSERDTDIGPIIDTESVTKLQQHIEWLNVNGKLIAQCPQAALTPPHSNSNISDADLSDRLISPCAYQIESICQIKNENFGPILHVIPFAHNEIQQILADINHSGYGLTMGLHSRNQDWLDRIISQVTVGNIYINRNMVGAKVSSQPFGGTGLSGTGPKAGGPNYLTAMVNEHLVTTNITAWGGNPELL
jgi:RHH-type proline utilization regulon transcriptional repressor/proline dehydrogenase/delta 1-pyrroline-5-carboxylate dehydrogenase